MIKILAMAPLVITIVLFNWFIAGAVVDTILQRVLLTCGALVLMVWGIWGAVYLINLL